MTAAPKGKLVMEHRFARSNASTTAQLAQDVPGEPAFPNVPRPRDLTVVFTDAWGTRAALAHADELARGLGVDINLVATEVVPFPLQLDDPPVASRFVERNLAELASGCESAVRVRLYLCRNPERVFRQVLPPGAIVMIGAPTLWRRWREMHLVRVLKHLGHPVLVVSPPTRRQ
jgi:hypothetical protein